MSHVFQLPDEQYTKLAIYAAQQHQTPETLFRAWVNEVIYNIKEPISSSPIKQAVRERREGYEEETLNNPLFQLSGIFAIGDPDLGEKHDEYLAEAYMDDHAQGK